MTALGINICTQDRTYGWADIGSTNHRQSQPSNLAKLQKEFRHAEDMLQGYIESEHVNPVVVARLEMRVKVAEANIDQSWKEFDEVNA